MNDISQYRVLLIEDNEDHVILCKHVLSKKGIKTDSAMTMAEAVKLASDNVYDAITLDYNLPDASGLETLEKLSETGIEAPVIMITGAGSETIAVESMKAGAFDYLVKGPGYHELLPKIIDVNVNKYRMLRLSERMHEEIKRLAFAVENINESVVMTDASGIITYVNSTAAGKHGYLKDELVNSMVSLLLTDSTGEQLKDTIFNDGPRGWHGEIKTLTKHGEKLDTLASTAAIRNDEGAIVSFVLLLRDITELKRTQDKLKKLSRAVEQSTSSVMITDANYLIEYVNPRFTLATGYTLDEVLYKNPQFLEAEDAPDRSYEEIIKNISNGPGWKGELRTRKKNGEVFWESVSISPIFNSHGQITHYVSVREDITLRKRAEYISRQDEARLETLLTLNQMMGVEMSKILNYALIEGVKLTESRSGYIGLIGDGTGNLCIHARATQSDNEMHVINDPATVSISEVPLWAETVRSMKGAYDNGASELTSSGSFNENHLCIPMIDCGRVVGIFGVAQKEGVYDTIDMRQLTLLGIGLWRTIMRKQAEDALRLKNRELEVINSITTTINRSMDINEVADQVLKDVLDLIEYDAGALYLFEIEEGSAGGMQLISSMSKDGAGLPVKVQPYLHHFNGLETYTIHHEDKVTRSPDIFEGKNATTIVPLFYKGKVSGIMAFFSSGAVSMGDDRRLQLTGIGSQLGIAIENYRLFKKVQDTSRYMADIINESPDAMLTTDMDGVIITFNKSASRLLVYAPEEVAGKHISSLLPSGADIQLDFNKSYVREFIARDGRMITLNISTSRLYRDDIKNGYIITLKDLSEISGLKIVPLTENAIETDQIYHFKPGNIYFFDKRNGMNHMEVFADQVKHNIQGLCVTRQNPVNLRKKYGIEKTPIVWLNGSDQTPGELVIKPDNMSGLAATLNKFIAEAKDCLILLDGMEYLMTRNSYESILKFIHFLNDRVMQSQCRVLFCIDSMALDQKQFHVLISEMVSMEEY